MKIAVGTIETIVDLAEQKCLSNPAVIVIGEVVALHPQFVREEINKLEKF